MPAFIPNPIITTAVDQYIIYSNPRPLQELMPEIMAANNNDKKTVIFWLHAHTVLSEELRRTVMQAAQEAANSAGDPLPPGRIPRDVYIQMIAQDLVRIRDFANSCMNILLNNGAAANLLHL